MNSQSILVSPSCCRKLSKAHCVRMDVAILPDVQSGEVGVFHASGIRI